MRSLVVSTTLVGLALLGLGTSCKKEKAPDATPPVATPPPTTPPTAPAPALDVTQVKAMFKPLPASFDRTDLPPTDAQIALGRQLYFDARLSKNQDVSCNTCHQLDKFGVDALSVSKGHRGQTGNRNSPTVFNAAGHLAQFWDGRAADVEAQAKGPVLNAVEMGMPDDGHVVAVLTSIPGYVDAFKVAFPGEASPVTFDNMAKAIGAFERRLVTPGPFDRYLGGDETALAEPAKQGLAVFMATGCTACHSGPLLGGAMYMKTGLIAPYADTTDLGRFGVTKVEADRFLFKVPSLRNVAKTAPYFHDGKIADLPAAVREMARIQLGKTLTDPDVEKLVAFLGALTGEPPAALITAPTLPPSGKKTPKPDPS